MSAVHLSEIKAEPLQRCLARMGNGSVCGNVRGHLGGHQYGRVFDVLWDRIHLREMLCPLCGMHPMYVYKDHADLFVTEAEEDAMSGRDPS